MSTRHEISAAANGASGSANLYYGQHSLFVTAATWDAGTTVTVEASATGAAGTWCPAKDMAGQAITANANGMFVVPGGISYRLNVSGILTTTGLKAVLAPSSN